MFLTALLLVTPPVLTVPCLSQNTPDDDNIFSLMIESEYRGKTVENYVILPDIYHSEPEKRFPVLYLLHGAYGSSRDWIDRTGLAGIIREDSILVVCPDGDPFGWYLDSPVVDSAQIESYMIKELIPAVDNRYRTISTRDGRGICGLSMGGHGAFTLAAHYPRKFLTVSSLSGVMDITRRKNKYNLSDLIPDEDRARWLYYSVIHNAEAGAFPPDRFKIKFDTGKDDITLEENLMLHDILLNQAVPHLFHVYSGTHSWEYWDAHIGEHIRFHRGFLGRPR